MKPTRMLLPFFFASLALAGCNARNAQRIAVIQLGGPSQAQSFRQLRNRLQKTPSSLSMWPRRLSLP